MPALVFKQYVLHSIIDFGDSQYNPLIYELALAIMYLMTNCTEIHPNLVNRSQS
jgi:Ser/Thr protein kinase RdoA (MazF antagonist)